MMLKLPASAGMSGEATHDSRRWKAGEQRALPDAPRAGRGGGIDHVVAGGPFGHQAADGLGRVLQVGIHQHDRVATGVAQAGVDGGLMAEVSRQVDHADMGIACGQRVEDVAGGVGRAVVDEDDFLARATCQQRAVHAAVQLFQHKGFVVDRQHDADQGLVERWTGHGISRLLARSDGRERRRCRVPERLSTIAEQPIASRSADSGGFGRAGAARTTDRRPSHAWRDPLGTQQT